MLECAGTPPDLRCSKVPTILLIPYIGCGNPVGISPGHERGVVPTTDPGHMFVTTGRSAVNTSRLGLGGRAVRRTLRFQRLHPGGQGRGRVAPQTGRPAPLPARVVALGRCARCVPRGRGRGPDGLVEDLDERADDEAGGEAAGGRCRTGESPSSAFVSRDHLPRRRPTMRYELRRRSHQRVATLSPMTDRHLGMRRHDGSSDVSGDSGALSLRGEAAPSGPASILGPETPAVVYFG